MMQETRNIRNIYWYWETEAIKADLDSKRHPFSVLCSNWANDFNVAGVIRNANAFLASRIYFYGSKRYNRRGTVGTHNYEHIEYFKDIERLRELSREMAIVAVDNVEGAEAIDDFVWPKNTLMAFGQEQTGVPKEILNMAQHTIYIRQFGSVRSLNASVASGICMYDWCRKNA